MADEAIYGINPAIEVVRAGRRRVRRAYIQTGARLPSRPAKLAAAFQAGSVPVEWATRQKLFQLCRSQEHQGVVLLADSYPYAQFEDLLDRRRLLLLDNVEDPQNVGAILRSAEVFGWNAVLLSSRGVPEIYPSVVKASAGAAEHLLVARDRPANGYVKRLQADGFTVVALDPNGREPLAALQASPPEKMLLVIGGEHLSVGRFILNQAQHVVGIPRRGKVGSLNASVAAGIALFALGGVS